MYYNIMKVYHLILICGMLLMVQCDVLADIRLHQLWRGEIDQLTEIHPATLVTPQPHGKTKRDTFSSLPPSTINTVLQVNGHHVNLSLTLNPRISMHNEVLVMRSGQMEKVVLPQTKTAWFYQCLENRAALMVTCEDGGCHDGHLLLEGVLYINGTEHTVLPVSGDDGHNHIVFPNKDVLGFCDCDETGESAFEADVATRKRRSVLDNRNFTVELLMVTDYSVYAYWYAKTSGLESEKHNETLTLVRQYYAFVLNGMDLRYQAIDATFRMRVTYSNLVIAADGASSNWTEDFKQPNVNNSAHPYYVEGLDVLESFRNWTANGTGIPHYDHAMLFTEYDLFSNGSEYTLGQAYVGVICEAGATSIVESNFNFGVILIATHELGHGLGAHHDGVANNTCSSSHRYIMSNVLALPDGSVTDLNPWTFSPCSLAYFEDTLMHLDNESNHCLETFGPDYDPAALDPYLVELPGTLYSVDTQCSYTTKTQSYMCRALYGPTRSLPYTSICVGLFCCDEASFAGNTAKVFVYPARGTPCQNASWCIDGVCVHSDLSPILEESCPFGDAPGIVAKSQTCTQLITDFPGHCYNDEGRAMCCASCTAAYTGIVGCEYGDKASDCATQAPKLCNLLLVAETCCQLCANTTMLTPTTTPATTAPMPTSAAIRTATVSPFSTLFATVVIWWGLLVLHL